MELENRTVVLNDSKGNILSEYNNIEVPKTWSQTATTILATKYFRKIIPKSDHKLSVIYTNSKYFELVKESFKNALQNGFENSIVQVAGRLAYAWSLNLKKNQNLYFDQIFESIINQKAAPNSPQWFNTGLYEAYGITFSNTGHYFIENKEIVKAVSNIKNPQVHACFIQSVDDNLIGENGIMDLVCREARLFKYGSGSGTNFSTLRGKGELLAGGGTSSGIISWLKILDSAAGSIKSGGTTRRAAKMCILNINHPDIEDFITWKYKEELKAKALIQQGYDSSFEGEAYTTISGQNSNNSVRLTKDFMELLKSENDSFELKNLTNGETKIVSANKLWNDIATSAWYCADPGVQFDDHINKWNTCPNSGRINASNPCCVSGDTLVSTTRGLIPIKDLTTEPFLIYTHTDIYSNVMPAFKSGNKLIYRLKTYSGYELKVTSDHLITTDNGDIQAGKLSKNMRIHLKSINLGFVDINEDFARCIGIASSSLSQYLDFDPIILEYYCEDKFTLDIFQLNLNSVSMILKMLFSVDSSIELSSIVLHHKNKDCLKQIQLLLLAFNILSKIDDNMLFIENHYIATFRDEIGIEGSLKSQKLEFIAQNIENRNLGYHFDYFHSLEEIGYEDVYDLTEPLTHHFIANGIIIHNCEYMFLDDTACNLASINLMKFLKDGMFDYVDFMEEVSLWTYILNLSIDIASYPSKSIAQNSRDFRTIGLGFANLGSLLMNMGIPYESEEGYNMAGLISSLMTAQSYSTSALIAYENGAFPKFDENSEAVLNVIDMHINKHCLNLRNTGPLFNVALDTWYKTKNLVSRYGCANAQVTLLAPTGTIGFVMDCDTTGIEPDFSLVKYKKMVGGSYIKIANSSVSSVLKNLSYSDEQIKDVLEYIDKHSTIKGAPHVGEYTSKIFYNANEISYLGHLKMMQYCQWFLSGAISKTVNLPESSTIEDIKEVYYKAWEMELKAVALYRNNCKQSQPLNIKKEEDTNKYLGAFGRILTQENKNVRLKLPSIRTGRTYQLKCGGQSVYLRTGEYKDGKLGEIFLDSFKNTSPFRSLLDLFSISVSLGLQYGVPLEKLVEKFSFTEFEPRGLVQGHPQIKNCTSIIDATFRILNNDYLKNDSLSHIKTSDSPVASENLGPMCKDCGHATKRSGTCYTCTQCGSTSGCS